MYQVNQENVDFLGIWVKYNIEPLSVRITGNLKYYSIEFHEPYLHLITRLCGIVGGIYVTVGAGLTVFKWIMNQW